MPVGERDRTETKRSADSDTKLTRPLSLHSYLYDPLQDPTQRQSTNLRRRRLPLVGTLAILSVGFAPAAANMRSVIYSHYIKKDDVVFMCMAEESLGRKVPFSFLADLQKKVRAVTLQSRVRLSSSSECHHMPHSSPRNILEKTSSTPHLTHSLPSPQRYRSL